MTRLLEENESLQKEVARLQKEATSLPIEEDKESERKSAKSSRLGTK